MSLPLPQLESCSAALGHSPATDLALAPFLTGSWKLPLLLLLKKTGNHCSPCSDLSLSGSLCTWLYLPGVSTRGPEWDVLRMCCCVGFSASGTPGNSPAPVDLIGLFSGFYLDSLFLKIVAVYSFVLQPRISLSCGV